MEISYRISYSFKSLDFFKSCDKLVKVSRVSETFEFLTILIALVIESDYLVHLHLYE